MSKKMMVNATHPEENRVAIVEDGILTELDIEVAGREPSKGNIYKAVVVRVETGLQAAFVDYGAERLGFLQIDEVNYTTVKPDYKPAEDGRRPRINELLHRGQEILVQITKEERGTKGAALTTFLSLAGRYMVLMPGSQTRGVSRKAESDSQRKALKKAMASLDLAEGVGYIVRTAALDQTREELERDYRYLIRLFESIQELEQKSKSPALIYKESNLMIRSIRDYFTTEMDEVLIDDPQVFKEAKEFFQLVMPDQVKLVKLHQERRPIFSRYQIEDQIDTLSRNQVSLPSGGSIVIDPTEALVAIDVNSGKMSSEQGVEATATKTNLEAAAEVGRQLRLRDLGGLIVIDFIDMRERKNNRQVEDQVKKSLENDKARVNVGRISKFGLLEMSRQRIKGTLTQGSHLACPHCNGTGHLKSPETQAVALLRKIHASAAKGQVSRVNAQLPIEVAAHLLNHNREELVEMERRYQLQIHIHGNRDFLADQVEIEIEKKEKTKATQPEYVEAGTQPPATEEPAKQEETEATQETAAETEAEPAKKRRRRRRRKPAGAATAEEAQSTEQSPSDDQKTESIEATEAPVETTSESKDAEAATAETAETTAPAKKPQRRRRSSSKSKPESQETETSDTTEAVADAEKPAEARVEEQDAVESKPKRRRSRRKPKASEDTAPATEVQAQTEEAVQAPEQPATEQSTEDKAEVKPKAQRPRRSSRKTEPKTDAPESSQDKPAEQTAIVDDTPAEKPVAKKPARRSRKKKEEELVAPTDGEAKEAAPPEAASEEKPAVKKPARPGRKKPAEKDLSQSKPAASKAKKDKDSDSQTVVETEEKPKPRRTSRAKPKPTVAEAPIEASTPSEEKPAEKKPAKRAPARSTTKKAPAKATAAKKKSEATAPKKEQPSVEQTEEKPKPKRRRTVKKKPAEEPSPTADK